MELHPAGWHLDGIAITGLHQHRIEPTQDCTHLISVGAKFQVSTFKIENDSIGIAPKWDCTHGIAPMELHPSQIKPNGIAPSRIAPGWDCNH